MMKQWKTKYAQETCTTLENNILIAEYVFEANRYKSNSLFKKCKFYTVKGIIRFPYQRSNSFSAGVVFL